MKTINVHFSDEDFEMLKKEKGFMSWREFILRIFALRPEFWRQAEWE